MHVAILGCGPAGLSAACAALGLGHEVTVISKAWQLNTLYGCQYLHAPIPGFEDVQRTRVHYNLVGTPDEYRKKVYGDQWQGKVSPEDFVGEHDAWDIRQTYLRMFTTLEGMEFNRRGFVVHDETITGGNIDYVRRLLPDKIISTIPANFLCKNGTHVFAGHLIYANGDTEPGKMPLDYVVCNGKSEVNWYRISNVFGYRTVEWPAQVGKISEKAVPVYKPLQTDCNCNPEVIRVGRYGAWDKSVLVHQVYGKVVEVLSA